MVVKEYSFEILKNYPSERKYLIRKPMEKTVFDTFAQMIMGKR